MLARRVALNRSKSVGVEEFDDVGESKSGDDPGLGGGDPGGVPGDPGRSRGVHCIIARVRFLLGQWSDRRVTLELLT